MSLGHCPSLKSCENQTACPDQTCPDPASGGGGAGGIYHPSHKTQPSRLSGFHNNSNIWRGGGALGDSNVPMKRLKRNERKLGRPIKEQKQQKRCKRLDEALVETTTDRKSGVGLLCGERVAVAESRSADGNNLNSSNTFHGWNFV